MASQDPTPHSRSFKTLANARAEIDRLAKLTAKLPTNVPVRTAAAPQARPVHVAVPTVPLKPAAAQPALPTVLSVVGFNRLSMREKLDFSAGGGIVAERPELTGLQKAIAAARKSRGEAALPTFPLCVNVKKQS